MPTEITTHIFEEIKFLANAIGELGLPEKIYEAAKEQDEEKYSLICEQFVNENPELAVRLSKLYDKYISEDSPEIFFNLKKDEEPSIFDEGMFKYDSSEIDPNNLLTIIVLSDEKMDDVCLFRQPSVFWAALMEKDQTALVAYLENNSLECFYDLISAFDEEFLTFDEQ